MSVVYVRMMGGLGNQMFQYAAARTLAGRHGAEVVLDTTAFDTDTTRRFALGAYPIRAKIADDRCIAQLGRPGEQGQYRLSRFTGTSAGLTVYREPHFKFDPRLAQQSLPLYIDGYWQSERYFAEMAGAIRRELTPTEPLDGENAAIAAEIEAVNAVSVHVRRGDYVSDPRNSAYFWTCTLDYYRAAIDHIRGRADSPDLFVFSDDTGWARENLASDLPTIYVSVNPPEQGFRDMQLMSLCKHHIIANSSFSWWGAWLNPSSHKVVVAPRRWFKVPQHDTDDLIPDTWVRL